MTNPGLGIGLPREVTDTSYPWEILRDDPRLAPGSMILSDPSHPVNPWPAGVPADASTTPNLAYREAIAMFGSGSQSSMALPFERHAAITGAVGLVERSAKGGLHVLLSITATLAAGQGVAIRPQLAAIDWMVAHPTHAYYSSLCFRGTRFGNVVATSQVFSLASSSNTANLLTAIGTSGNSPADNRIGFRRTRNLWRPADDAAVTPPFADPILATISVSKYTGTPATSGAIAQLNSALFKAGYKSQFVEIGPGLPSRLFMWGGLEDLTYTAAARGITVAQAAADADARDYAEYQKQVLNPPVNGSGGRYYGDTYTAPATIA